MIKIKRTYDPVSKDDGRRILVDRLWPRGLSKEKLELDRWAKEWAPSTELRKWFAHDPQKWLEFQKRYKKELEGHEGVINEIADEAKAKSVTLIYGAKDQIHNEAVVLLDVIQKLIDHR